MYQRIKNRLDAGFLLEEMRKQGKDAFVGERIAELAGVLDDAYGAVRKAHDMGGYILYFPDAQTYEDTIVDIWEFYHIEPTLYEYMECIGKSTSGNIEWIEKLFLLSSDDSLVLIYPQEAGKK